MENKYTKYLQLSNAVKHFDGLNHTPFKSKWLTYFLSTTALILWITFNIIVIENNQFSPYLLVFMNIILYCIIAVMASPDHYSESASNGFSKQNEHRKP